MMNRTMFIIVKVLPFAIASILMILICVFGGATGIGKVMGYICAAIIVVVTILMYFESRDIKAYKEYVKEYIVSKKK